MDTDPSSFSLLLNITTFFSSYGIYLSLITLLLFLSAMVSGSEVAFFSLSRHEAESLKKEAASSSKAAVKLLQSPRKLLATILIFNNLVNVGAIIISTFMLNEMATEYGWKDTATGRTILVISQVGIVTFTLLFWGEITPKIYATQRKMSFLRLTAAPLLYLTRILTPLSWILVRSTRFVDKRLQADREGSSYEEIKHAIELTSDEESSAEEKEILRGIVNFSNIAVKSVMRARVDIKAIEINTGFEELIRLINDYGFSRLPIYEESIDQIKGILYLKDLLPLLNDAEGTTAWQTLIREAYFIPESKKIDDLLDEFKAQRLHIAIVVDEFGGTAGLVTLEDIIEEIFGEINDEFDDIELIYSQLSANEYVFSGKTPLLDFIKITGVEEDGFEEVKGEADSIAGLILELHGKIPQQGDKIEYGNYEFIIESVARNRINRVKFTIHEEEQEELEEPFSSQK